MVTLRILHIVFGVLLAGNIFFLALFLEPKLKRLGPGIQNPVMGAITPILTPVQLGSYSIVVITGVVIALIMQGGNLDVFVTTGWGWAIFIGTVLTAAGGVVGFGLTTPVGIRLGKLGQSIQGRPPTPEEAREMEQLGDRIGALTRINFVLVLLVVAAMSAARFV
jgi:hypothetical protein